MDSFINFCIEFVIAFILIDACIKIGRGIVDIGRMVKMLYKVYCTNDVFPNAKNWKREQVIS